MHTDCTCVLLTHSPIFIIFLIVSTCCLWSCRGSSVLSPLVGHFQHLHKKEMATPVVCSQVQQRDVHSAAEQEWKVRVLVCGATHYMLKMRGRRWGDSEFDSRPLPIWWLSWCSVIIPSHSQMALSSRTLAASRATYSRMREEDAIEKDNRSNKYSNTGQCVYQRGICIQYTRHKWLLWVATEHPRPVHRTSAACPQNSVLCLQIVGTLSAAYPWSNLWILRNICTRTQRKVPNNTQDTNCSCRERVPMIPKTVNLLPLPYVALCELWLKVWGLSCWWSTRSNKKDPPTKCHKLCEALLAHSKW